MREITKADIRQAYQAYEKAARKETTIDAKRQHADAAELRDMGADAIPQLLADWRDGQDIDPDILTLCSEGTRRPAIPVGGADIKGRWLRWATQRGIKLPEPD